jgi:hypothetical protein
MTNDPDWNALEEELLARVSPQFDNVSVGGQLYKGARIIAMHPTRLLSRSEVMAAWKEMVPIIRREIPDRQDGWAVKILVERRFGPLMGAYEMGWAGRDDQWVFLDEDTDHAEWLVLLGRLRKALLVRGLEWHEGKGDFSLPEEDNGLPKLTVYVHRMEVLTEALIGDIQALLRDGYADWSVQVRLMLSPPFEDVPFDGIEIWHDGMEEYWNRKRLKRILGDHLKI